MPALRICGLATRAGGARQHGVLRLHHFALGDLGERGQRAHLEALGGLADALERRDSGDVDERLGTLGAILEPVVAVLAAGEQPALLERPWIV